MSATSPATGDAGGGGSFRRIPLSGCILTKLDESLNLGEVINVCIQTPCPSATSPTGSGCRKIFKLPTRRCWSVPPWGRWNGEAEDPYFWGSGFGETEDSEFMSNMYMDQASGLRKMRQNNRVKVIAVSGGKGASARPT